MNVIFRPLKYILFLIAWFFFNHGYAQGFIQIRSINTNYLYFGPNEVWNIQTISTKSKTVQAKIDAFVTNEFGGLIYQSETGIIEIKPGIEILSIHNLPILKNTALDKQIDQYIRLTQTFPNGAYSICYTIQEINSNSEIENQNPITNCIDVVSEIQTPLLLNSPINESEIITRRPDFTWIPPMPIGTINGFNYNFYLYSTDPKKSCEATVSTTLPIYKLTGIVSNSLAYPNELEPLDTSKHYCWRVEGVLNKSTIANSDIWRFKIKNEVIEYDTLRYAHFVENPAALTIKSNTILMCDFDGDYFGDTLKVTITGGSMMNHKIQIIKVNEGIKNVEKQGNYSHFKYVVDPKLISSLPSGIYVIKAETKSYQQRYLKLKIL